METNLGASKNQTQDDQHHHHHLYHNTSAQYSLQPPAHKTIMSLNTIVILAIAIISFTVLFAILVIVILLHKLKSANDKNLDSKENGNIDSNGSFTAHATIHSSSPELKGGGCLYSNNSALPKQQPDMRRKSRTIGVQVFTYKELEAATEGFNERNVIGNGGYGVVYRGVLSDGTVAAIKRLHMRSNGSKHEERSFRLEVDLLSRLQCPYLVELLGYCADQHHRLLIFEFMANGTLQQHLHHYRSNGKSRPLDWGTRLRIALDCARALEFLHEYAVPTVIHRDFKCTNVLLDHNFRAKVSDFGLAKMGSDKINGQISTRVLGTTGYLAPEYASTGKLTTKSDVYSYGVVLLELLTGRIPIDSTRPPGQHVLVSWALPRLTNREKVVEMVDPTLHGQFTVKDLIQVAAIAAMCVQPESDYRPLMTDVVQSLIPLVKSYNQSVTSSGSYRFQTASPKS